MGQRQRVRRVVAVPIALTLALVAGCGDDDLAGADDAGDTTTTSDSTTSVGEPASTTTIAEPPEPTLAPGIGAFIRIDVVGDAVTVGSQLSGGEPGTDRTVHVPLNTAVRIEVVADRAEEVHLHGYDLTADLEPGEPGTIDFVADAPGAFEIELEQSHLPLAQLEIS